MMRSISFKIVPLLVALLLHASQTANAQGTCSCNAGAQVTGSGDDFGMAFQSATDMCSVTNNCDEGYTCISRVCNSLENIVASIGSEVSTVTGNCADRTAACVMESSGEGDPHLTGFDGSKFDFHGEHGKNYLLYGSPSGDTLVTKMREAETRSNNRQNRIKVTFFDEFGLQAADSDDKVRIYLAKDSIHGGRWLPQIEVNGKAISRNLNLASCRISFRPGEKWVSMVTKETKYMITVRRPEDESVHHLNVKMKVKGFPSYSERYLGILGVTLNRALGHEGHADLDVSGRTADTETVMRSRFEVKSLFPHHTKDQDIMLGGVVGIISDVKDVEKTWNAEG